MKLTPIQYDAIMQSIQHSKDAIAEDEFIDPYGEIPEGYNSMTLMQALEDVEEKLRSKNITT